MVYIPVGETIMLTIHLVNTLIKVFRSIRQWLKNRDPLFKENNRMIKILKGYYDRRTNPNEKLPDYIRAMVQTLRERKSDWQSAPGALQAEDDAEDDERYDDAGYTTEYAASEASDEDLDDDPPVEADSPVVSSSDEDSPVVSSDDDSDSPSPVEAGSPVSGSGSESDEFDSD